LHKEVRDMRVVVLYEDDPSAKGWINRALVEALQVTFAAIVCRMSLPGKHDLDRSSQRGKYAG